ncbi:MAG: YfiR family protein [Catalinimonas sp.]
MRSSLNLPVVIAVSVVLAWAAPLNGAPPPAPLGSTAAAAEDENLIYSVFMYHFTKHVKWPDEERYQTGDLVVGVLGDTPMMTTMRGVLEKKTVNGRGITVRRYGSLDEISGTCHILYLPPNASDQLAAAQKQTRHGGTLLITHRDGLGTAGSQINFTHQGGKPRFELNEGAMTEQKLRYTVALKSIAVVL